MDYRKTICEALDCAKYKTYMALLTDRCNGKNPYDYLDDSILTEEEFNFIKEWQYNKRKDQKFYCESFDKGYWQSKAIRNILQEVE